MVKSPQITSGRAVYSRTVQPASYESERAEVELAFVVEDGAGPVEAEVVRVIDGDTIIVRARVWLGQTVEVRVRLSGIDTPEIHGRCRAEKDMALRAKAYTAKLAGQRVYLNHVRYGKYAGRVLADVVTVTGDSISTGLVLEGLARKYDGGRREG